MSEISSNSYKPRFAIKAVINDRFVRAHKGQGNRLMAISKNIGDQETFRLIELDGCGIYALEAYNNAYVSVQDGDELMANQDHIKEWERFHIVQEADHFFITAEKNDKFVSMDFSGDQHLRANREHGLDWEKFIIGTLDDALNWETFKIEPQKT